MASISVSGPIISIETDRLLAEVHTEGYVSGVRSGTLVDKATGARDLGHGRASGLAASADGWELTREP